MLIQKMGLYSKYEPMKRLIFLLHSCDPRLHNRIPLLEKWPLKEIERIKQEEAPWLARRGKRGSSLRAYVRSNKLRSWEWQCVAAVLDVALWVGFML
jgi:hypothetical protein